MKILQVCPPHLSDVATLPWEIPQKSFSTVLFIHTSALFMLCEKKTICNSLAHPTRKCHHVTCELQNFFI